MRAINWKVFFAALLTPIVAAACGAADSQIKTSMDEKAAPVAMKAATKSANYSQPNIVIMMADDLGWADVGYRGSDIQTPNLDRLAAEGVRLEQFYSMPICTPTRAAMMTARDPMKLGTVYSGIQPWAASGVSPDEHFMPESFKAAGYQTAMVGKWHLGRIHEALTPNARGFDHFVGHLNTQVDYYTHGVAGGYDLQENGKSIRREGAYLTDIHGAEAVRYIHEIRDPAQPFFLYVPFLAPHSPVQAPDELKAKYKSRRNIPFPKKTYAAMVDSMDSVIGQILDALDQQGLAENTIVLFFSDNGGFDGFGASNKPLRGGKLTAFEGGVRVNALIRWSGQLAAGHEAKSVISVLDIFPTLAAASGVKILSKKPIDGQNRLKVLTGVVDRKGPLFFASGSPQYNRFHLGMREGNWKFVQIIDHQNQSTKIESMLFNLANDPNEQNDLSEQEPRRVQSMAAAINSWRAQHPIGGQHVSISPHPGWRAPSDYADAVHPAASSQTEAWDGFGAMATRVLQKQHGDKGRIKYE